VVNPGSSCGQPGVKLGSSWGQAGVKLGSTRGSAVFKLHRYTLRFSIISTVSGPGVKPLSEPLRVEWMD
jgi:hypothetical protein